MAVFAGACAWFYFWWAARLLSVLAKTCHYEEDEAQQDKDDDQGQRIIAGGFRCHKFISTKASILVAFAGLAFAVSFTGIAVDFICGTDLLRRAVTK